MKLELYKYDSCPYCRMVMSYIESQGIEVTMHDIRENEEDLARLIEVGGKRQVPCLIHDGEVLYESRDIVTWLQENAL